MSLAVEQTLPSSRVISADRPRSECHAAESFKFNSVPYQASGREDHFTTSTSATNNTRDSYDSMHRGFYNTMDDSAAMTTKSDQHMDVVEEQAPVLPQKSALRASRLLDNLVGLKVAASSDKLSYTTQDPHDEYLSSEEDASSTAGDFSDFDYDSSSDDILPSPVKECSAHQVTARVVSVIYSGKPVVVDVPQVRRSISPNSIERPKSAHALSFSKTPSFDSADVKSRRTSVSALSSRASHCFIAPPRMALPPRSSSMQPGQATKAKPYFLQIDPYANGSTYSLDSPIQKQLSEPAQLPLETTTVEQDRPKTPKTPVTMFRGVARAMSLMKRKSQPRLNQAYLSPSSDALPRSVSSDGSIPEEPIESPAAAGQNISQKEAEPSMAATLPPPPTRPPPRPELQPVTHDEILRLAAKNEKAERHLSVSRARTFHEGQTQTQLQSPISPISPLIAASPNTATKRISSFGFGRRRMSMKLNGGK